MNIFQTSGDNQTGGTSTNNQELSGVANVNVSDVAPGSKEGQPSGTNDTQVSPEGDNPTIILDGPLGRAYTQALNIVYAKEDTGTMALIIDATMAQDTSHKKSEGQQSKGVYVYATDGETLTAQDCLQASNWMTENKDKGELMISLEAYRNPSKHMGLLEEMAKSVGAKVFYSKESMINALNRKIKK